MKRESRRVVFFVQKSRNCLVFFSSMLSKNSLFKVDGARREGAVSGINKEIEKLNNPLRVDQRVRKHLNPSGGEKIGWSGHYPIKQCRVAAFLLQWRDDCSDSGRAGIVVQSLLGVKGGTGHCVSIGVSLRDRREVNWMEEKQEGNVPVGIWIAVVGIAAVIVAGFIIFLKWSSTNDIKEETAEWMIKEKKVEIRTVFS